MTELGDLQRLMEATYGERDRARGIPGTVAWLAEEVGELARAARKGTGEEQLHELGDVLGMAGVAGEPARAVARGRRRPVRERLPALREGPLRLRVMTRKRDP